MKRCPECRRDYHDDSLHYCLDDGAALVDGPASLIEPATEVMHADSIREAQTKLIDAHTTAPTELHQQSPNTRTTLWKKSVLLIAGLALVLLSATFLSFRYYGSSSSEIDSVAVLPFENGSGDPNLDYLSDGLSESLIDMLSELPQIKVIARNSSFKYRGADQDLQEAARKLGVRALVTGKVTRIGDNVSVHVEMVDTAENRQLWSEQYNRKAADLLSIQQDIARTASTKLRVKLSGTQEQHLAKKETIDPQAYELLLKGRYFFGKSGTENLKKAIEYFEQSVAADPNYALAHAELSLKYYVLTGYSLADPKIYLPKAEAEARRALELDDGLAEAHLAISRVYVARWQWQEGENERKRATELDPNNAAAHDLYAQLLSVLGRHDESIAQARRARELDPISSFIGNNLAFRLYFARRHDESIAELMKIAESEPDNDFTYCLLGYNYSALGQPKQAIAAYENAVRFGDTSTSLQTYLGAGYAAAGEREKANAILTQLKNTREYVSPAELAVLHAALGNKEEALADLEKAFAEHDLQLQFLKVDPSYESLHAEPRFQELVRRVGLSI